MKIIAKIQLYISLEVQNLINAIKTDIILSKEIHMYQYYWYMCIFFFIFPHL